MFGLAGELLPKFGYTGADFRSNNRAWALAGPARPRILCGSIALDVRSSPPRTGPTGTKETSIMAKSQTKAGGPTRGRKRVRKMGMGSGALVVAKHKKRKS